ncbi:methionine synthase reductase [Echinococcus multilocularis]|uniref:Methionine synthase reductase n=1 Tax=Echinococcus multilocularis TaxID=6211 RepID=A0A068YA60_ECHMU|nr:methionine synthase reductase [Echinococcus multilocularis]
MSAHRYHAVPCDPGSGGPGSDPLDFLNVSCKVLECVLGSVHCMNEGSLKHTYRVFLSLKDGDKLPYRPGDSVTVFTHNNEADVSWLLQRMSGNLSPDQSVVLKQDPILRKSIPRGPPVGVPITPRLLVRHHLELHSLASRKTIQLLANSCNDEEERRILLKMSGREGMQLYNELIKKVSATAMDLLATFGSCRPSLETLLDVFPPLAARPYSLIDEYREKSPQDLSFAFTMIDFSKDLRNNDVTCEGVTLKRYFRQTGVATGYIHRLWEEKIKNGASPHMYISLHPNLNNFYHPPNAADPLILICAGTGIAPFISFLKYRRRLKQSKSSEIGATWLIFGCRDPNFDLLFAEELDGFLEDATLTQLCLVFSRFSGPLPPHLQKAIRSKALVPPGCKYVQDCICSSTVSANSDASAVELPGLLENFHISSLPDVGISSRLAQLVCEQGGHVRVCGDAKGMAPAVASAWTVLFAIWKQASEDIDSVDLKAGAEFLVQLRKEKRYIEDVWR